MASPGRTPSLSPIEAAPPSPPPVRATRERRLAYKHALDRIGAVLALALAAPLMLIAALVAKVAAPGPVIVGERRIDRDGRSFKLLAFAPVPALRRFAIDQLPQLVNVLKGEMSFVGPRPERPEFVELFGANLRRHDQPRRVRPGITGWAQVRALAGPGPLAERMRWDDWYVENWSLWLDARIVLMTVREVIRGNVPSDD